MADFSETKARVTIRDILAHAGIPAGKNRILCSIHGGSNLSAFSFTDYGFYCFACGIGGGLIDLVEYLHHHNRKEAVRYLCQLAGVPFDEPNGKQLTKRPRRPITLSLCQTSPGYMDASQRYEWLDFRQQALATALRTCRNAVRLGRIPPEEFYANEQYYLHQLEELDTQVVATKNQMNQIRKKMHSDRNS